MGEGGDRLSTPFLCVLCLRLCTCRLGTGISSRGGFEGKLSGCCLKPALLSRRECELCSPELFITLGTRSLGRLFPSHPLPSVFFFFFQGALRLSALAHAGVCTCPCLETCLFSGMRRNIFVCSFLEVFASRYESNSACRHSATMGLR